MASRSTSAYCSGIDDAAIEEENASRDQILVCDCKTETSIVGVRTEIIVSP